MEIRDWGLRRRQCADVKYLVFMHWTNFVGGQSEHCNGFALTRNKLNFVCGCLCIGMHNRADVSSFECVIFDIFCQNNDVEF